MLLVVFSLNVLNVIFLPANLVKKTSHELPVVLTKTNINLKINWDRSNYIFN